MGAFLEAIGGIGILIALAAAALIVGASGGGNGLLVLAGLLPWLLPAVVGFMVIAAFGSMLQQLQAIRRESEAQTALLKVITASQHPAAHASAKTSV